jgi:Ca-activated chloride channel family protein
MIGLDQFHFLRPWWFAALLPAALLLWRLARRQLGSRGWESICDPQLLPHVLIGRTAVERRWPLAAVAAAAVIAVIALAGPSWEKLPQPVFSTRDALVIALDLTRSMDATDVSPSRVARARFKIADILKRRQEGQTALLVYSADAFTVTPMTEDAATILSQLPALTTDIMPAHGNRTDRALELAGALLRQAGHGRGDVLLITDEVDAAASPKAAELRGQGYRVSILGVGSEHGVPVALADGSFLKDAYGAIVMPALNEAPMRQLARAAGGVYVRMSPDDSDIDALAALLFASGAAAQATATEVSAEVWLDRGPWFVLLLLPLAALAFRRGHVLAAALIFVFPPQPAQAFEWSDLWLRSDQQAKRVLDDGDAQRAAELFRDPGWKGAARYRSGDFEDAARQLSGLEDTTSLYNLGNALARLGQYEDAIAAYDEVLRREPEHDDARFNRELLEQELEQQQQQQQQGQDQQQQQQDDSSQSPGSPPQDGEQEPSERPDDGSERNDESGADDPPQSGGREDEPGEAEQEDPGQLEPQSGEDENGQGEDEQVAQAPVEADMDQPDEEQQAAEQWLRRIPDDPAGLLRRKFLYQYRERGSGPAPGDQPW